MRTRTILLAAVLAASTASTVSAQRQNEGEDESAALKAFQAGFRVEAPIETDVDDEDFQNLEG